MQVCVTALVTKVCMSPDSVSRLSHPKYGREVAHTPMNAIAGGSPKSNTATCLYVGFPGRGVHEEREYETVASKRPPRIYICFGPRGLLSGLFSHYRASDGFGCINNPNPPSTELQYKLRMVKH